jgi:hypothetical protein
MFRERLGVEPILENLNNWAKNAVNKKHALALLQDSCLWPQFKVTALEWNT